ncbi:MAG: preprotein translocase subunit SecY [Helicobacteraceae bacterium]|jgi:preprotein translocase subunit SecY|nr:preprotein translocase subunit SecY [Helicobacteraceae bacterium]
MDKTLVNKILITLGFLLIFRVLAYVPTPGIDVDAVKEVFNALKDSEGGGLFSMFSMFSGNAVERFSIISLGIMPYITAAIIMELMAATVPELGKMKKERDGMQRYMQIVRYLTVGIALIQSIGVAIGLNSMIAPTDGRSAIMLDMTTFVALAAVSMTAGTMILLWIGEQITQRGVGNGTSLIIFGGIVASIPNAIGSVISGVNTNQMNFLVLIMILLVILATVAAIIYVELAERRVPISYSRKVQIESQNKRVMNYIPIKINLSGVIPPIFASAILMFPLTVLQGSQNQYVTTVLDFLNPNGYVYNAVTFFLVIFFAYFYASIVFNPKDIAENLKRQGGFIPGVRPGQHSSEYLSEIASRLTLTGAIYLAIISTLPWVLVKSMGVPFYFGGTAVLIVVQVALDTMRKIEAQIYMSRFQTLSAVGL